MEIKLINVRSLIRKRLLLMIMRTFIFLLCTTVFSFNTESSLAQEKVTIDVDKVATIDEVFEIIIDQTKYRFLYPEGLFKDLPKVQLKKGIIRVDKLLNQSLGAGKFNVVVSENNTIIIKDSKSQEPIQVVGKVVDESGLPVSGATVLVKGTTIGVATDFDGSYTILVPNRENLLVFSALGFATQEIIVGNQTNINIVLKEEAGQLGEVIINAGYYKVKKKEQTGSISRVSNEDIERQPVNNPLAALQGRMTGVDIIENSGVPGGGFQVRIRGQNSILAGNDPLYIIDGVPYDSKSLSDINVSVEIFPMGNISPLNAINPSTIESIEVLKDADATAIYGSRGANGVVLITTKKGKEGKTNFSINSSTGFAKIIRQEDLLNTEQYLEMRREAFSNDGISEYPDTAYDLNGTWDMNRFTDWQEVLVGGTSKNQNIQASFSGGSEQTQFLLSGMYNKETTVFPGNFEYDRINVNSNTHHQSKDNRFDLSFNMGYSFENNTLPKKDLTYDAISLPPNAPSLYEENGQLNWENSTWTNPLAALQALYKNSTNSIISNASIKYQIDSNLGAKIALGYANNRIEESYISPNTAFDPAYGLDSSNSLLIKNNGRNDYFIIEPQLDWNKVFKKGKLNILLGATYQKNMSEQQSISGYGFPSNEFINNLSSASEVYVLNEDEQIYTYQSFFSRINYTINDKIFLNLTGRRDGSSRFGPGNKYGNFGAFGAAWLFSEDFHLPWLDFGKLRGSYGITGNDQIGDYQYLQTYILGENTYDGNISIEPARLYNPDFQWEINKKAEIALELGLFKNRISSSIGYYRNRSSNQLINYTLPSTTGFNSILANLDAVVQNTGLEFEVSSEITQKGSFSWNVAFNMTVPENKLISFPDLENSTYTNRFVVGESLSIVKLYNFKGVNQETGLFEFEDYNGDGQITSAEDRQFIANLNPTLFGGLSNNINYKNWELDFLFQFVKKNGRNQYNSSNAPGTMFNQPTDVLNRWQQAGDNNFMQQFTTGANYDAFLSYSQFSRSSAIISDASFVRLKSLELAYKLPMTKNSNTSCRIYLRGQNLLTFTKFKGADPEQTRGYLPSLKRISIGAQFQL